ncbi:uncharacterized protein LOC133554697 [Nerophis ophidion]|uniref:uncharacterized protein LOC133554697 n=1 Tax=Nerophis ophidion TaxID=159077 RepID=UPI002AE062C4|nr:uncharacterized protein LOC133554697 [Nerophis ophidion]
MSKSGEPTEQVRDRDREDVLLTPVQPYENGAEEEKQQEENQELRRGTRLRTLTEKGKGMLMMKINTLQFKFNASYGRWRAQVKAAKMPLSSKELLDESLVNSIIGEIKRLSTDVMSAYEELRQVSTPEQETRRKVDTCTKTSTFILSVATSRLDRNIPEEEPEWAEAGSIFNSTCKSSVMSILKGYTESTKSSVGRQEAAAEAAASQAVLKVLQEQEREQLELNILEEKARKKIAEQEAAARKRRLQQEEDEVRRRIQREEEEAEIKAQLEEEHIALQRTLEEKRRKIKKLETVKSLNAANARMLIYDQRSVKEERSDKLGDDFKEDDQVSAPSSHLSTHRSSVSKVKKTSNDSTAELVKMLAGALSVNRIPIPEPATFSGDPLKYSDWKLSFKILIDQKNIQENEKIYYLRRYIGGQAKKALDGYFLLGTESAYTAAWEILEERYGNPFTIAKAYRDKLQAWPKIGSKDSLELREFTDFLRSCEAAMVNIKALEILNDCNENRKILSKLPDWLIAAWNRKVMEMEQEKKQFPSFSHFVRFLTWEAKVACNPITSVQSLKSSDTDKPRSQRLQSFGAKTLNTSSNEKTLTSFNEKTTTSKENNFMTCIFCERNNHTLHKCRKLMEKAVTDRVKFIQAERLCFGCLQSGHRSKNCSNRSVCDTCEKKHPTCLHEERTKDEQKPPQAKPSTSQENPNEILPQAPQNKERTKEATSCTVILQKDNIQTAAIIPVWLSSTTQPTQEVLVYALLDSQSDTTFVLSEVADALEVDKEQVKLKLSTMTSRITVVSSQKVTNLQVRGFYSGEKIALPPVYTREFIPANRTHIPTSETAKAWSHLKHLQDEIPPPQDCGVGLLIGYNCSQALLPREVVSGKEKQPYAQRTDLGWSIIGNQNPYVDYGDVIRDSHRIVVRQVTPGLKPNVNLTGPKFLWQTQLPKRECTVGEIKEDDPEAVVCNTNAEEDRSLLNRLEKFSDWSRVVRAIARLKRCGKEHKGVKQRTNESTSLEERK